MKEFTTLKFKISNLTDWDMLFHFMDMLQIWDKINLEKRQFKTIVEDITLAMFMTNFKHNIHDKEKVKYYRSCLAKGVRDRSRDKKKQKHPM